MLTEAEVTALYPHFETVSLDGPLDNEIFGPTLIKGSTALIRISPHFWMHFWSLFALICKYLQASQNSMSS